MIRSGCRRINNMPSKLASKAKFAQQEWCADFVTREFAAGPAHGAGKTRIIVGGLASFS